MPVSLWLRPEAAVANALDEAIADYALPRGRTPFPAHLTLASGTVLSDNEVSAIAAEARSFTLEPDGVLETSAFFQIFALRFQTTEALLSLRNNALTRLEGKNSVYIPHLSLTYGLPTDREVLQGIVMRFTQPIRFDRLMAIRYDDLEPSQAAVAAWRLSDPLPLGG